MSSRAFREARASGGENYPFFRYARRCANDQRITLFAVFVASALAEAPRGAIRRQVLVRDDEFGARGAAILAQALMFPFAVRFLIGPAIDAFPLKGVRYKTHAVYASVATALMFCLLSWVLAINDAQSRALSVGLVTVPIVTCFLTLVVYRVCVDLLAAAMTRREHDALSRVYMPYMYAIAYALGTGAGTFSSSIFAFSWTRTFYGVTIVLSVLSAIMAFGLPHLPRVTSVPAYANRTALRDARDLFNRNGVPFVAITAVVAALIPRLDDTLLYLEENYNGINARGIVDARKVAAVATAAGVLAVLPHAVWGAPRRRLHFLLALGLLLRGLAMVPYMPLLSSLTGKAGFLSLYQEYDTTLAYFGRFFYSFSRHFFWVPVLAHLFRHTNSYVPGLFLGIFFSAENIASFIGDTLGIFISDEVGVDDMRPRNALFVVALSCALNVLAALVVAVVGCFAKCSDTEIRKAVEHEAELTPAPADAEAQPRFAVDDDDE